jgi:hypothetical protein
MVFGWFGVFGSGKGPALPKPKGTDVHSGKLLPPTSKRELHKTSEPTFKS